MPKNVHSLVHILLLFTALVLQACGGKDLQNNEEGSENLPESSTQGRIHIAVDESLEPVIQQHLNVFDSSFPKIEVNTSYLPEADCFRLFFQDSCRLIVVTRDLTASEKLQFDKEGVNISSLAVAMDALALIVSPGVQDSLLTLEQFKAILTGTFARDYAIVFDNERSGTLRYLLDTLIPGKELSSKTYALKNNEEVINYVSENKNAIGVVGVSHIYDANDQSGVGVFRKDIQVVALQDDLSGDFFQPYQAYLALLQYPLTRPVYFISREGWPGPASSFANFLSHERGQLIFNKARLVPLRAELRIREAVIKP